MSANATPITLIEGAVLGLLVQEPRHGFVLVPEFARDGSIGRVFHAKTPVVYRALNTLEQRGYVVSDAPQASSLGPSKAVRRPTALGVQVLLRWLAEPARYIRDVRLEMFLKLAVYEVLGRSPRRLLEEQLAVMETTRAGIDATPDAADLVSLREMWRAETAEATIRFLRRALVTLV